MDKPQEQCLLAARNMDKSIHEDEEKMKQWNNEARRGPFAFISIKAEGVDPGMGKAMGIGALINVFISFILFLLVKQTNLQSVMEKSLFIATCGAVGAIYPHLSNWKWWHFPAFYCFIGVMDLFITWGLAGLAMMKLSERMQ